MSCVSPRAVAVSAAAAPSAAPSSSFRASAAADADVAPGTVVRLVLLRHGESTWNAENLFTGWTDVPLSAAGEAEGRAAGALMRAEGLRFDRAFTSVLRRAVATLGLALEALDMSWLPVTKDWRLNERSYGALQGLNKAETAAKFGAEQVKVWRRAFAVPPPALEPGDARHPARDARYAALGVPAAALPASESLKDCVARVLPCWEAEVAPLVRAGKRVLVVAHGNSLRALIKHLDGVSDEGIAELNVPTGVPLLYELEVGAGGALRVLRSRYLGDEEEAKRKAAAVAAQASTGAAATAAPNT
jgi:2,3-bisphosphoglycerate-dependent phosphoglycerate mutase